MTVHLHRAPRTDLLADELGELLLGPRDDLDPFAEEVVVVPAKGVERWLTQRLSHRLGVGSRGGDGVCAGVRFLNPGSLVSLLLGRDRDDVWHPDRLVWPLLATIDAHLSEPWCATLARHLGQGSGAADAGEAERQLRRDRRWSVARRLAGLFAGYAAQRPGLIDDWAAGRDTDGAGGTLDADLRWQAELWRRLVAHLDVEPPDQRLHRVMAELRAGGSQGLVLPARLSLFGHTRLPASEVELLSALGTAREVHLWLPQPSPALWRALGELPAPAGPVARADDPSIEAVGHPLLASLGRDARELRRTLQPLIADDEPSTSVETASLDAADRPDTLLGWLQHDVRANHAPTGAERADRRPDVHDRSLQVHACHGPARQVEVLREVLVGLLADDPTLEPRDIVVMCPDVETFAPLIGAAFGLGDEQPDAHPAHRLRVRLADRGAGATNPLLAVAADLVALAGSRVTASQVLDLAARPPVRRRFGLGDDDLERLAHWVGEAGVRWGIDEQQRAVFAMQRFEHNTWQAGLDRLLLGVVMSGDDHRHVGRGLPLDDVGGSDLDLTGRLSELVDRLAHTLRGLAEADAVGEWTTCLLDGVGALADVGPEDAWQVPQLERELHRAVVDAGSVSLRLADVRAMLASRLGGRPTRSNFRTGTLTVCTMVPMRSVPHRVVCLVGLDDGAFPRSVTVDGDDVLARRPLTGERDPRSEDRQLLLDALLAATDTLVITHTGAGEHTGATRPPAVPLGELLDAADLTLAEPVRHRVLTRHSLQAHDPRNLEPGALVADRIPPVPFSFDAAALAGARAVLAERQPRPPLLAAPLPPSPRGDVDLAELRTFFAHPVRSFLRGRLGVGTPFAPPETEDAIPVQLDALEKWHVGDHLLAEVLAGADPAAVMTAELLRGTLPPGVLGSASLDEVVREVQSLVAATAPLREGPARSVDVDIDLGEGRRLSGTVTGVYGNRIVALGYSKLKPRLRLATWIDLLALSIARPDEHWTGHAVGKAGSGPQRALSGPLDHRALDWLRVLVDLRDRGLDAPLPAPIATACAWATAAHAQSAGREVDPRAKAAGEWTTDPYHPWGITGEDDDAWHRACYGDEAPLQTLLDAGLAEVAIRIWSPLLEGGEKVGPL